MKVSIYQMQTTPETRYLKFNSLDYVKQCCEGQIPEYMYECVFCGEVDLIVWKKYTTYSTMTIHRDLRDILYPYPMWSVLWVLFIIIVIELYLFQSNSIVVSVEKMKSSGGNKMSNKDIENILQEKGLREIGLDDPFQFQCIQCGKCCRNREDILLSPQDLFRMARELKISPEQFIRKYGDMYIGRESGIPIVRLRPLGQMRICPLLKNNKCMVHKVKPVVCAAYPLGRFMKFDADDINTGVKSGNIGYVINSEHCGNGWETHTVREWLSTFGILLEDDFFVEWSDFKSVMVYYFRNHATMVNINTLLKLYENGVRIIYFDYDIDKEFFPQFRENVKKYKKMLEEAFSKK